MNTAGLRLPPGSPVGDLARAIADRGGRCVVVGGWVRDQLCGRPSHDLDSEVFGLEREQVTEILAGFGFTPPVGKRFPAWRLPSAGLDVSFPRAGADQYQASRPESLAAAFREASRHRDLTINAIGWDPLTGDCLDPWLGIDALQARRLSAVDLETFASDPLRVLRLARLHSAFDAAVSPDLEALAREIPLSNLPAERIAGELGRILTDTVRPSQALELLAQLEQLRVFDPVDRLRGVPQDPRWHPEGDVFVHTMLVIDRAAELAEELAKGAEREVLMWSALCHDLGKPDTTKREAGRIRSIGHERRGARITRGWLESLRLGQRLISAVEVLVAEHLVPAQFIAQGAGERAYRRLARRLDRGRVTVVELEQVARADHLGRTTEDAKARRFDAGTRFLAAAEAAQIQSGSVADVVSAAHWLERGVEPGPELGRLLQRCREVQDDTGWADPKKIIERVLQADAKPAAG